MPQLQVTHTPTSTTPLAELCRPALKAAGPLAVLAVVAFAASIAMTGGGSDEIALARSPLSLAASMIGLASLTALVIGLPTIAGDRPVLYSGPGRIGYLVAATGTVLAAGGQWAQLFALPGIADAAPELLAGGIPSVITGYIASYILLALGWITMAVLLLRSGTGDGRAVLWLLLIGALVCIAPLPVRFAVLAVGTSLLARPRRVGAEEATAVPQASTTPRRGRRPRPRHRSSADEAGEQAAAVAGAGLGED